VKKKEQGMAEQDVNGAMGEVDDSVSPAAADGGERCAAEVEDLKNKILRLQADFDNYRRRTQRVRAEAADDAKREVLMAFLPVYDNFVRALEQAEQSPELLPFLKGFELIQQNMEQMFADLGLESIPAAAGTAFDPNVHDAAGMLPGTDETIDTIAQELQRGFIHKNLVVRPARVLVYGQ
jgi:molecular chaperone GrpE